MMQSMKITVDHDFIRGWVQAHGGMPAASRSGAGLDIDFSAQGDREALEIISWNEFFQRFEKEQLALLYREGPTGDPQPSLRIVSRTPYGRPAA